MSLIRIRRERKADGGGPIRPPRLTRLLIGLVIVLLIVWYLSQLA